MSQSESIEVSLTQAGVAPPHELHLFKSGENTSKKGTFVFDEKAAELVMAAYRQHGVERLPFDFEHKMLEPGASEADQRAAGWFTPEIRYTANGVELWATNIQWTDRGRAEIEGKERLYFSPAFKVDAVNRVIELINVALTNLPAMHGQTQLIAAKAVPYKAYPAQETTAWDADAAKSRVKSWSGDDMSKYREAFAWYDSERPDVLGSYKLPHHDMVGGRLVTARAGVIAAGNALSGARGGVDIPEAEIAGVRSHLAQHYRQFDMSPPWEREERMKNSLIVALSLKDDAAEAEVMAVVATLRQSHTELLTLTGADSVEAAFGVLRGWQAAGSEVETLKTRVAELETAAADRERTELLNANKAKFTPAELDGWVKAATIETLRAYIQTAPNRVALNATELPQPPKPDTVQLTDDDRHVAKYMGISIEEYAKNKAEMQLEGEK